MIALALGWACYGLIVWVLTLMVMRVIGPSPEYMGALIKKLIGEVQMLYFTVRFEDDDAGLWQIIEDREGNRYRVHIRDAKGEMKW